MRPPDPNTVERPITLDLSGAIPPAGDNAPEASPEVLADIRRDEVELARRNMVTNALVVLLFVSLGALPFVAELRPDDPRVRRLAFKFVLFGVVPGLFAIFKGIREWRQLKAMDEVQLDAVTAARKKEAGAAVLSFKDRMRARVPYASLGIAACFGLVYLVQMKTGFFSFAAAGFSYDDVRAGEWWRMVTGLLLHADEFHITLDFTALLFVGGVAEAYGPRLRVPLVFLVCGVAASGVSLLLSAHGTWAGSSAAILGLAGYTAVLVRRQTTPVPPFLRNAPLTVLAMAAFAALVGVVVVDNTAHLAAPVIGAMLGWLTIPRQMSGVVDARVFEENDEEARTPILNFQGWVSLGVLVAATTFGALKIHAAPRFAATRPIAFYDVNIVDGAGYQQRGVTVVVSDRILYVQPAGVSPIAPPGAQQVNGSGRFLAAATFDRSNPSPLDGLRHIWVGQVYEGAPGDVVLVITNPGRTRRVALDADDIVGAVVSGRYYSFEELTELNKR